MAVINVFSNDGKNWCSSTDQRVEKLFIIPCKSLWSNSVNWNGKYSHSDSEMSRMDELTHD